MRKYPKAAAKEVEKEMRLFKKGKAKSGKAKKTVKSRKQAIAIGLATARKKGIKVPKKVTAKKKTTKKQSEKRKTTRTKTTKNGENE